MIIIQLNGREQNASFLAVISNLIFSLEDLQLLRIAKFVSLFSDSGSIQMAIQLFIPAFIFPNGAEFIKFFSQSLFSITILLNSIHFTYKQFDQSLPFFESKWKSGYSCGLYCKILYNFFRST